MQHFFSDPDHLSELPKGIDYRNILMHCKEYLHLVRLDLADSWLDTVKGKEGEEEIRKFWKGEDPFSDIPLFKEIEQLCGKIGERISGEDQFIWIDGQGNRVMGLNPNLSHSEVNPCLFGDCTGLRGEISPELRGDLSGLTGTLNPELQGRISPLLKGNVTGIQGRLCHLEGELNRELVGNITGIDGFVNPELTGDTTGLIGKIDPRLKGDCTGLIGTVSGLIGDCTGLIGRCSLITGDCTGLTGDCTGISGDCTGLTGDLSEIPWDLRPNYLSNFPHLFSN